MKTELFTISFGIILVIAVLGGGLFLRLSATSRENAKSYMTMRESAFQSKASLAGCDIGEQIGKHAMSEHDAEKVVRDYFSKLNRDPARKKILFYITRDLETWREFTLPFSGEYPNKIVWCIRTCEEFPNEWLVLRAGKKWECGDFSIVDSEFIKSSLVEYCSFYELGDENSRNSIMLDEYEYGGASPAQDEEAAAAE